MRVRIHAFILLCCSALLASCLASSQYIGSYEFRTPANSEGSVRLLDKVQRSIQGRIEWIENQEHLKSAIIRQFDQDGRPSGISVVYSCMDDRATLTVRKGGREETDATREVRAHVEAALSTTGITWEYRFSSWSFAQ